MCITFRTHESQICDTEAVISCRYVQALDAGTTQRYRWVVLPEFLGDFLPPGIHRARWSEVVRRFGGTSRRQALLRGLRLCLEDLHAAGCTRAWLNGSFVTTKENPGDFDLVWDLDGVTIRQLHPVLTDLDPPRIAQDLRYGGDILPNVQEGSSGQPFLDFFQQDSFTGRPKGIVELDPGDRG
jgi:hypothetical protein